MMELHGKSPIRVGLAGTGFGVSSHLPAWRTMPGVTVTALFSADPARGKKAAADNGIPASYDSFADFVAADVDLIDIASTPEFHAEHTLAAIAADKHVICEKPFAPSFAEVE